MGFASEEYIAELNHRYETDEEFRREYDEQREIDAAEEEEFFQWLLENEKHEEFFTDKLIDVRGNAIELPEPEPVIIDTDDIPF